MPKKYPVHNPEVCYLPPQTAVIRAFAAAVCGPSSPTAAQKEVVTGLANFLEFIAQTSAKYLNLGHHRYLLKGYQHQPQGKIP